MSAPENKDPLHGKTLKAILIDLVDCYGWEELGSRIRINCFNDNPSLKSSLTFLRKTSWAREKVERLYLKSIHKEDFLPPKTKAPTKKQEPGINLWTGNSFEEE